MERSKEHPILEIIRYSLLALLIVIPIRLFIAQPFIVSGASMDDTFHHNEYLIVDQVSYRFNEPVRGDIVIFRYPENPSQFFIKRVIAVPGDTISIYANEVMIRNEAHPDGFILDEPYAAEMSPDTALEMTLQDDEYFVMGDNRNASSDSRVWGTLQREYIVGQAFLRLYPVSEIDYLPGSHPLLPASNNNN